MAVEEQLTWLAMKNDAMHMEDQIIAMDFCARTLPIGFDEDIYGKDIGE